MNIREKIIELFQKHLLVEPRITVFFISVNYNHEGIFINTVDLDIHITQDNKRYWLDMFEFIEENITFNDFRLNLLVRDLQKELKDYYILF